MGTTRTIHGLIEQRMAEAPDDLALVVGEQELSRNRLHRRASALAQALIGRGIGQGQRVAVMCDRNADLVIAILAILQSGAAYVPIDPNYPLERVHFMLEDAGIALLLTQSHHQQKLPGEDTELLFLDRFEGEEITFTGPKGSGEDPAYVIYTSGSTGRPKGVAIPHKATIALTDWAAPMVPARGLPGGSGGHVRLLRSLCL